MQDFKIKRGKNAPFFILELGNITESASFIRQDDVLIVLWDHADWRIMRRIFFICCACLIALSVGCAQKKYRRLSPEVYYKDAQDALKNKKCYDAELLFRNMLSDFPGSHLSDEAQFGLGKAFQCQKDYVTAIFEYERLLNEYPVSPYAAEARFQIGECYYQDARDIHHDQDETHKAIREFARFIEDYPQSDLASQAQDRIKALRNQLARKEIMIAYDYILWKYYSSAKLYAKGVLGEYPDTESALEARFIIAQVNFKTGALDEALNELTLLIGRDLPEKLKEKVIEEMEKIKKAQSKLRVEKP